ncbi:substrate-binding domain-containing protein [Novosphingobium sp. 9]|uniref:substrate-binding domain-containing protein n=1 Tax=Novosphingobium sp. 9 TaxID=2025349 RepID=UPI0021B692F4|nr:substrate-binding domain-containing protein [Novosphingobium sp. 9]
MKFARFLEGSSVEAGASGGTGEPTSERTGVQIALLHDGTNMPVAGLIEAGLLEAMAGSGVALLVQPVLAGLGHGAVPRFLADHRPAAVVIAPPLSYDDALGDLCAEAGVTALRLGPIEGDHAMGCDERSAMAALVAALIARGHTRIALVSGADLSPSARLREMGYLDMLAEHGLDRGPSLIVPGDDSFASGQEAARLLFQVSPCPARS